MLASQRSCPSCPEQDNQTPILKRSKALIELCLARYFAGRAHSAAHSSNLGPGRSVRALCAGFDAPIPSGGQVEHTKRCATFGNCSIQNRCINPDFD